MYGDQENARGMEAMRNIGDIQALDSLVIECALYRNLLESGRDTWEDVSPTDFPCCMSSATVSAIANALLEWRSGRFVDVELQATRKTLLR